MFQRNPESDYSVQEVERVNGDASLTLVERSARDEHKAYVASRYAGPFGMDLARADNLASKARRIRSLIQLAEMVGSAPEESIGSLLGRLGNY